MADALKAEGNKAFSAKEYATAMYFSRCQTIRVPADSSSEKFSQAIDIESSNHILYSNRSAVYSAQSDYQKALDDATKATELKPDWSKGWARKGAASRGLGDLCK
jgi:stress-induced-phosphoprotein 1